jgi:hypothetical protein
MRGVALGAAKQTHALCCKSCLLLHTLYCTTASSHTFMLRVRLCSGNVVYLQRQALKRMQEREQCRSGVIRPHPYIRPYPTSCPGLTLYVNQVSQNENHKHASGVVPLPWHMHFLPCLLVHYLRQTSTYGHTCKLGGQGNAAPLPLFCPSTLWCVWHSSKASG